MIYVLRYHEDVECVSKEALQETVWAQPGGAQGSQRYDTGAASEFTGPLQDIRNDAAQEMTQRGVQVREGRGRLWGQPSSLISHASLLEAGLS